MTIQDISFDSLGQALYGSLPEQVGKALLYAELEPGVVLVSVFYDVDGQTFYLDPNDALFDEVEALQAQFGPDVRAFEFEMLGEQFKSTFTYVDQFDDQSGDLSRRGAILTKHFGHRSANYPEM